MFVRAPSANAFGLTPARDFLPISLNNVAVPHANISPLSLPNYATSATRFVSWTVLKPTEYAPFATKNPAV